MQLEDAIRIAYRLSPIVPTYLNAIDRHSLKNPLPTDGDVASLKQSSDLANSLDNACTMIL